MVAPARQAAPLRGRWLWLFPASYAIHIAEEGLAGERFYRWIRRVSGREASPAAFIAVNLAGESAMVAAVRQVRLREDAAWLVPALGTVTAVNGIGHLAGSVVTRSYSPGLVSGVGVWAPLGLFAIVRSRRLLPRPVWRRGVTAGALILGGVVLLALPLSRPSRGRNTGAGEPLATATRLVPADIEIGHGAGQPGLLTLPG